MSQFGEHTIIIIIYIYIHITDIQTAKDWGVPKSMPARVGLGQVYWVPAPENGLL